MQNHRLTAALLWSGNYSIAARSSTRLRHFLTPSRILPNIPTHPHTPANPCWEPVATPRSVCSPSGGSKESEIMQLFEELSRTEPSRAKLPVWSRISRRSDAGAFISWSSSEALLGNVLAESFGSFTSNNCPRKEWWVLLFRKIVNILNADDRPFPNGPKSEDPAQFSQPTRKILSPRLFLHHGTMCHSNPTLTPTKFSNK